MREKGKPLEQAVKIIQEALKDTPNTKVLTNEYLLNNAGEKREFDVVIIHQENGKETVVAIECKNHKGKIPVKEVEAYFAKCYRVPKIDKKIMVSVKGFQSGAISAARDFDVDIYTLDELNINKVNEWVLEILSKMKSLDVGIAILEIIINDNGTYKRFNAADFGKKNKYAMSMIGQFINFHFNDIGKKLKLGVKQELEITFPIDLKGININNNVEFSFNEVVLVLLPYNKQLFDYESSAEEYLKYESDKSDAVIVTQKSPNGIISKVVATSRKMRFFWKNKKNGDYIDTGYELVRNDD